MKNLLLVLHVSAQVLAFVAVKLPAIFSSLVLLYDVCVFISKMNKSSIDSMKVTNWLSRNMSNLWHGPTHGPC